VKVDRATMMHGLEARAPFLDVDFVDFVRRIPASWKYRHGQTKYILKRALEPCSRGRAAPKEAGLRGPGGSLVQGRAPPPGSPGRPPVRRATAFIGAKLAEHRAGRADQRAFLWNAWLLQAWFAQGARPAAP
jgi:asparagine synthase (glutamine-hydrolysing)